METLDMVGAIVLGLLLLAAVLGGLVWLDRGPVGEHGRTLRKGPPRDDEDDGFPPDDGPAGMR